MKGSWVPHDTRDQVVDYVHRWTERAELPAKRILAWLELREGKFYDWAGRYPQSNGKLERWHGTIKSECIRPGTPLSLDDARRLVARWVEHYNQVRLHSALGYITPADKLAGREETIFAQRDQKLEAARQQRQMWRQRTPTEMVAELCLAT